MPPPQFATIATVQNAISALLLTYEPQFLAFGLNLFKSVAVILISWHGVRMMFSSHHATLGRDMYEFAHLLMFLAFGYAMVAFYATPLPLIGLSFSRLITDQAANFANILDARSLELTFDHLDELWARFVQPNTWALLPNLLYWLILIVIAIAKGAALLSITFGMIATAVCGLLGPIFVPFFIVPKLNFLFWGWLKAYLQYAFVQVVAFAYLMVFERFVFQLLTTVPTGILAEQYLLYGVEVVVVIGAFAVGTLLIPSLTASIFSGTTGQSVIAPASIKV